MIGGHAQEVAHVEMVKVDPGDSPSFHKRDSVWKMPAA